MSKTQETPLPTHLRGLAVDIPRTWTPEAALAVFELIDDLRDKICTLYDCQLQALLREQSADRRADASDVTHDRPALPPA